MIDLSLSGLWRATNQYAKVTRMAAFKVALNYLFPRHRGRHVRHLSDHLARDIGFGPAEMARHRHIWPSQSSDRPRI